MSNHDPAHADSHEVPASLYIRIWLALLCLTAITISVAALELEKWAMFTALLIATVKATLVALFFMHMKYEKPIVPIIILVTLGTFGVFLILTFTDYPFR